MIHTLFAEFFNPADHSSQIHRSNLPSILDPACGEGAFLLPAFDELLKRCGSLDNSADVFSDALQVFQHCLFGVDVDAQAVEHLRERFLNRLNPKPEHREKTIRVLTENLRVGDSLTGCEFGNRVRTTSNFTSTTNTPAESSIEPIPLDWTSAFPEVAAAGGFDLIVSNPPYLREKDAKPMFDRIARTPLGQKCREPRMDLWFYFLHRTLDLLRENGRLSFIVNEYWTTSSGARKLRERIRKETTLEYVELLGNQSIFDGVSGRHMIFQLQRGLHPKTCQVVTHLPDTSTKSSFLKQHELFVDGKFRFEQFENPVLRPTTSHTLGSCYEVRQGIAENPPFVTRRHLSVLSHPAEVGDGIFVLTPAEVRSLQLSKNESALLRPYFRPASIERFEAPAKPAHFLLYLTRKTAPSLTGLPRIEQHLQKFRSILNQRREVQSGSIHWWHLHWPREERLFTQPRILNVQMGKRPTFAYAEQPTFVGFSLNVVLPTRHSTWGLPALTAILNSRLAENWFVIHAKKRGVGLEINGGTLRRFPLPEFDSSINRQLARLVLQRQFQPKNAIGLEKDIESLVEQIDKVNRSQSGITTTTT
ncbi:MAG: hypothetical protein Tsb009_00530 [Planctomycetaceae bacterium]